MILHKPPLKEEMRERNNDGCGGGGQGVRKGWRQREGRRKGGRVGVKEERREVGQGEVGKKKKGGRKGWEGKEVGGEAGSEGGSEKEKNCPAHKKLFT